MTTPEERTRSILDTRDFLELLATADEVAIPGLVASAAKGLLRHYPLTVDIAVSASAFPGVWAEPHNERRAEQRRLSAAILPLHTSGTDRPTRA